MSSPLSPASFASMSRRKPDYSHIPVLLVDDEPVALKLGKRLLERLGFQDINPVADGTCALSMLKERKFGIVISDWNMPEMTGLELVRRIRADEKLAKTPFLMTSVDGAVVRARVAREAGVNAFLIKPFGEAALRAKLHEVLGPSGMRTAA
jgi:two-component system, chemotaxis family, chemotaxis protein CheY